MRHPEHIECAFCGGEAEFDLIGGIWWRATHDCETGCRNHPVVDPSALYRQLDNELESRWVRSQEGEGHDMEEQIEAAHKAKREMR